MDIVRPLVTSEDYVVQKYTKSHPFKAMGRVQVNHVKEAVAMEDLVQFQTRCEELADESVDTIFTDQVVYGIVSRNDVLDMVEDHIKHNVVRVPAAGGSGKGAYFQQAVGIPQGSVLSGLLCNYFFGHIEKRLLGDVLAGGVPERPRLPPGGGGARGLSVGAVGLEGRGDGVDGGSGGAQDEGAASSFRAPAGGKRARLGEREREGERPPKFARNSPACSCLGDAAAPDSGRAPCGGALGVPNGGGGGDDGNRGSPSPQSCRNTSNHNGRVGHGLCGLVGGARGGERCRLGGNGRDEQRGTGPAEGDASGDGEARPFPNPEGDCTLLRQVDDFLLISTSKARAESFVRVMHDEVKTGDWGFSVHQAKTLVNFDMVLESSKGGGGPEQPPVRSQVVRRIEGDMFPWCGVRFDTRTCEVMANYSRYSKSGVAESLTVDSRRAGACLVGKMKRFLSPKCHALMLDEGEHLGINSRNTVLLNVYEMLLVCAAKTATSALRLPRGPAGNASLLSNGALETTAYAYSLIQSRSNRRKGSFGTSRGVRCVCKVRASITTTRRGGGGKREGGRDRGREGERCGDMFQPGNFHSPPDHNTNNRTVRNLLRVPHPAAVRGPDVPSRRRQRGWRPAYQTRPGSGGGDAQETFARFLVQRRSADDFLPPAPPIMMCSFSALHARRPWLWSVTYSINTHDHPLLASMIGRWMVTLAKLEVL
ncbi:unnamed protein product [Ectocarpus fasciculatus]